MGRAIASASRPAITIATRTRITRSLAGRKMGTSASAIRPAIAMPSAIANRSLRARRPWSGKNGT